MKKFNQKPSRQEAEEAVKVLLKWIGEDPYRDGLIDTPARVIKSYEEFFCGYDIDPAELLSVTFSEIEDYSDMVILQDIAFQSYCEHHMVPIIGEATIVYLPNKKVVGISKLARVVDAYAKRLQIQERLTIQIANIINEVLDPLGVAVFVSASHQCITMRGVKKSATKMQTSAFLGCFKEDPAKKQELFIRLNYK